MRSLITLALIAPLVLTAQVGINTTDPKQALDVNGKIQIADDAAPETEGSIRFNPVTSDFEGYNGEWKSFTEKAAGLPSNAQFVTARLRNVDNNSQFNSFTFSYVNNGLAFTGAVPSGKYLLVTGIFISPSSLLDFSTQEPLYSILMEFGSTVFEARGKYTGGNMIQRDAAYAPLAVVRPSVTPRIMHLQLISSLPQLDQGVDVTITGFLVDDVDFN